MFTYVTSRQSNALTRCDGKQGYLESKAASCADSLQDHYLKTHSPQDNGSTCINLPSWTRHWHALQARLVISDVRCANASVKELLC